MQCTVMPSTEWDREFIAHLAAERARLREPEVVGIRGLAATHKTRLMGDIAQVLSVAIASPCSDREDALVDALRLTSVGVVGGGSLLESLNLRHCRIIVRGYSRIG